MNPLEDYFWNRPHKQSVRRWAHYLPIFHRHFAKFRDTPVRLLEIGTSGGGGLYMWRDYFGEKASIFGIDVKEISRQVASGDFEVSIGDQGDPAFLREVYRQEDPFDSVVIERKMAVPNGLDLSIRHRLGFKAKNFQWNVFLFLERPIKQDTGRVLRHSTNGRGLGRPRSALDDPHVRALWRAAFAMIVTAPSALHLAYPARHPKGIKRIDTSFTAP